MTTFIIKKLYILLCPSLLGAMSLILNQSANNGLILQLPSTVVDNHLLDCNVRLLRMYLSLNLQYIVTFRYLHDVSGTCDCLDVQSKLFR